MLRTRETAAELARVARMLTLRSASNEELQKAIVFVIDAYVRLAQDLEESNLSWPSGASTGSDQKDLGERPKGS